MWVEENGLWVLYEEGKMQCISSCEPSLLLKAQEIRAKQLGISPDEAIDKNIGADRWSSRDARRIIDDEERRVDRLSMIGGALAGFTLGAILCIATSAHVYAAAAIEAMLGW